MLDENKYYWALAEMIAAAGLLAQRTGAAKYWAWYDKCWAYAQVTPQRPPHRAPRLTVAAPTGALHRRRARRLVPDGERGQHPRRHARGAGPHRAAGEVLPLEDGLPPTGGVLRGPTGDGLRCGGGLRAVGWRAEGCRVGAE